ncbi:MAG: oligosaccharide flippase family protein [Oscillospiraceae bacterium]|nr:oligosaccharide flippase family protein [Oscillospiraceae bacterium]
MYKYDINGFVKAEKNGMIGKENNTSFTKNLMMLIISQLVIKLLGFVYRIVMMNIPGFGDVGKGFYNSGYQIYAILLTVSSVGIPTVISKLVAERVGKGDNKGAHRIFKISLVMFTSIGLMLSLALFFFAEQIATFVLNIPEIGHILRALAPAIVFVAVSAVLRGYFAGLGSMKAASVSQTLEQFLKCVLTITLVYSFIGSDPVIMAAAGNLATTLAIIVSFSYLFVFYQRRRKGILEPIQNKEVSEEAKEKTWTLVKAILVISVPMTLGSLVGIINGTIDTITIARVVQGTYEGVLTRPEELRAYAMELVRNAC